MKFAKGKNTNDDDLGAIHRLLFNSVQSNVAEFVQVNKYGIINVGTPNSDDFYSVQFLSMPYTLQEDQIVDNETIKSGTIVSKAINCVRLDHI
eukprot:14151288-Ditylum_brightwellii.AAC.1